MYENVHPKLVLLLLFVHIDLECEKGLLFKYKAILFNLTHTVMYIIQCTVKY